MNRVIECVPNFSEGRDQAKIDSIVQAMEEVPGVFLLDRSSDPDHNRSVVTIAGEPEAVAEAAIAGVGKASELIDLRQHRGAHPRMGAADVVPFVPLTGISMAKCVEIARNAGQEIWRRFHFPVYFYGAAATRPERTALEEVRRGGFEGICEQLRTNSSRAPDIGGPQLHQSAGAVAIGVREPLIAFNILLKSSDVSIAKRIARKIRSSNGGLPFVKALGLALSSKKLVQVSMNLTNFEQTSMRAVYEEVAEEAEQHGVEIAESEIVGLIPRDALDPAAAAAMKLHDFSLTQVLENRLETLMKQKGAL